MSNGVTNTISSLGLEFAELLADAFDVDSSPDARDRFFLELAKRIRMEPGGRAEEYLDHFLLGSGKSKNFDIGELIASDKGVSNRLQSEVVRRVLNIRTIREKDQDQRMTLTAAAAQDRRVITIFQKNYENTDWQLSLGTFPFTWEVIGMSTDKRFIIVTIGGQNTYKWHPSDQRITQFLHRAGHRLAEGGGARNFEMVARPLVFRVSTVNREMLQLVTLKQTNPTPRGLFGSETSEAFNQANRVIIEIKDRATQAYDEAHGVLSELYESMAKYLR